MVYFLRDRAAGLVKIGCSRHPRGRVKQLQTGSGNDLELLGAVAGGKEVERVLHRKFSQYRLRGEWFEARAGFMVEVWGLLAKEGVLRIAGASAV